MPGGSGGADDRDRAAAGFFAGASGVAGGALATNSESIHIAIGIVLVAIAAGLLLWAMFRVTDGVYQTLDDLTAIRHLTAGVAGVFFGVWLLRLNDAALHVRAGWLLLVFGLLFALYTAMKLNVAGENSGAANKGMVIGAAIAGALVAAIWIYRGPDVGGEEPLQERKPVQQQAPSAR